MSEPLQPLNGIYLYELLGHMGLQLPNDIAKAYAAVVEPTRVEGFVLIARNHVFPYWITWPDSSQQSAKRLLRVLLCKLETAQRGEVISLMDEALATAVDWNGPDPNPPSLFYEGVWRMLFPFERPKCAEGELSLPIIFEGDDFVGTLAPPD